MYALKPSYVLLLDEVLADPLMRARVERVLAALPPDTPREVITLDELPAAAQRHGWDRGGPMGVPPPAGDPGLFLGVMRWDGRWDERREAARAAWPQFPGGKLRAALGYDAFQMFSSHQTEYKPCPDHVCRPAWRIHMVHNCPHKCFYCSLREPLMAMANVEEYVTKLAELSRLNPWQKTWLFEDDSEALALEPELGGLPAIMDWCARSDDNYVIVHTKSANVDWLEHQDHRGRTILVWSLTARTQSDELESGSATMAERIEAARRCQEWGYTVRFKFKPIVPVLGWREELAEMIRLVFERTRPDVISLFMLAWMDHAELVRLLDPARLDPRFVAGAAAAAEELKDSRVRPFPHELRREVYQFCFDEVRRWDTEVPVSLSTETTRMWHDLGPVLGLEPSNYPCGCGPQSVPGLRRLPVNPWQVAQPVPVLGHAGRVPEG